MKISVDSFSKRYGRVHALDNVNLTIESGQIVAVLGVNGAGNTTFLRCPGLLLPSYSVFPLSYREISSVISRPITYELDMGPLAIVYASALARRLNYSFGFGAAIGIDVVLIVMALQPVIIAGYFSSGTNDARLINWQTESFFTFALVLLVIMLIALFMMFIVPTLLIQAGAIVVLFVTSSLGWLADKLLYERGRIDVLSRPRGQRECNFLDDLMTSPRTPAAIMTL